MSYISNPQLELAYEYVQFTNKNIFLTGKAGTGKTTFLRKIKKEVSKRTAVVAPTGVAAINAKGMTIHSLFQLPFGPFLPERKKDLARQRRFSKKKISLLRSLDLLIIDEISMVRSDMLDAIDDVLRRYRNRNKAFGGVQLLMIGDLHQLPPVVRPAEWDLLRVHYDTPYFFGSRALQQTEPVTIQLTHIYRQADGAFIDLLNKVRDNQLDDSTLQNLNSRYVPDFTPPADKAYITLTTHNATAQSVNEKKLAALSGESFQYRAKVEGIFPESNYPTEAILEFKKGAQVLFIKNDSSQEKRYYNGKIGQITAINQEQIVVQCPDDNEPITVTPEEWKNIKYQLNSQTNEVEEEVIGTFSQFPLKLAWAITIHKSQGLTFDRAIIDAQSAFDHGQVYVALSRCRTFEGIVLRTPINQTSVRTDLVVKNYSEQASKNKPDIAQLQESKRAYQIELLWELFRFEKVERAVENVRRIFLEQENTLTTAALQQFENWSDGLQKEVIQIANKFQPQLRKYLLEPALPEENTELQERLKKAGTYFLNQLRPKWMPALRQVPVNTDNQKVKKQIIEQLKVLERQLIVKTACFEVLKNGFVSSAFIKTMVDADLNYDKKSPKPASGGIAIPKNIEHPELYKQLYRWREEMAADEGVRPYEIIQRKTLLELVTFLPTDQKSLLRIKGIGKAKSGYFGQDLLQMIRNYTEEQGLETNLFHVDPPKGIKPSTKQISLNLFKQGKTIPEIAKERGFVVSTIHGHLSHFIKTGELKVSQFLSKEKVEELSAYMNSHPQQGSTDIVNHFGGKYSYGDIRMVRNHLEATGKSGTLNK